jgi:hypothetical protein
MKIKILGISIFEYQPSEQQLVDDLFPPAFNPVSHGPLTLSRVSPKPKRVTASIIGDDIPNEKTMADLFTDSGSSLPLHNSRNNGPRLNIDACLDLYGITSPNDLWNHDYKPGSAGYRIRAALGGVGYGPKQKPILAPAAADDNPMTTMLKSELPKIPGTKQEDLEAGLKLFGLTVEDPSSLWNYRYLPGTAGYRLKEVLRCRGYKPPTKGEKSARPTQIPLTEAQLADIDNLPADVLPRLANGKLDVEGGIKLLKIDDTATLWRKKVKFGSALHLLKQAIGTNAGRMSAIQQKLDATEVDSHE